MCGFVGFTSKLENKKEVLNKMMDRIIHRGPDMAGDYIDETIALGFRRLSILDLSEAGRQPMVSPDGRYVITFNGEIYNFKQIKEELIALGHSFVSECDTEALLHGYMQYGEDVVYKLRGMFAFVIWDKQESKAFGARDFFGIKPFYYTSGSDGSFIFGSEIKSFLEHPAFVKDVNPDALRPYLTFQYSSQEETFFKGVYKLPPAHYFVWQNGEIKIERYWDVDFKRVEKPFEQYVEELDTVVNESVSAHRISDVKVASFLSGGIDSSYITASLMPDKTFSVGFDFDRFNETNYAKELSDILGIENVRKLITADECFDMFPTIQYHMDEPQSNPSSVPLYFLAGLATEHVTVVLSGEGADEIYAGYEEYDISSREKKYRKLPYFVRRAVASVVKRMPYFKGHDFLIRGGERPEEYFVGEAHVFSEKEADDIVNDRFRNAPTVKQICKKVYDKVADSDELTKKQYLDLNLWLPGDILLKADKMSMAHSLELRVPFLDKEVMKHAQGIPHEYKINGKNTKYVLREASRKTLPNEWADRIKLGFPVPIRFWLREEKYYNNVKEYFSSDYAAEFFDRDKLLQMLEDHKNEKANNQRKIWTVYTFLVWYKRFFIDEK
ncbi:MAG: asparagine synthase (glutamine-hydrolyzing) [Clostridia bacterium]|nr:asparagine synthase (glutamine-hydrolyzing) [Clostridia bacterium]